MAIPFLHNINLTGNEIQNVKLHNTTTAPTAAEGAFYFHTSDNKFRVYVDDGSPAWENVAFESWVSANFNNYSLPLAANGTLGGIQIGYTTADQNYAVQLDSEKAYVNVPWTDTVDMGAGFAVSADTNTATTTITEGDTLTIAGGTNVTTVSNPDGTITIDATDTDTTYTAGTGLTLTGTVFSANVNATAQSTAAESVSSTASRTYAVQVDSSDNLVVNVPWVDTDTDTNDDVSNANLLAALAALESTNGAGTDENITIGASAGDTIVITGNLTVQGTTTTLNTETVTVEDNIILLNSGITGTGNGTDAGIEVNRGDDDNVSLFWDESEEAWTVTNTSGDYQILQAAGSPGGKIKIPLTEDASPTADNVTSVTKSSNKYTINHELSTQDLIIQIVDISDATPTFETVFADIERPTTGTITVDFANAVTDGDYKLLATQI